VAAAAAEEVAAAATGAAVITAAVTAVVVMILAVPPELKEAAVHPVGRPTSLEATTARIDGRLRAQAKAATTAPSPIPLHYLALND